MEEYLITTDRLTKQFGKHKAVNEVSMHIRKGSVYGFIGKNGAGKTTFMKILCGLANKTSGSITAFGETEANSAIYRKKIGCLIEAPGIFGDMTAFQNVKAKCLAAGVCSKEYIDGLLSLVGLADVGKKKAKNFSLGMRQRLGIALALVGDPEMLVLDEPINGLDPQGIVEVREIIHKLATDKKITILISSHILDELSRIATDYGIINNGVLIKEMTAEELQNACSESLNITVDDIEAAKKVLSEMGITSFRLIGENTLALSERIDESAAINSALVRAGVMVSELSKRGEALEDYYIRLTGGAVND